jgi:hypothetical protein
VVVLQRRGSHVPGRFLDRIPMAGTDLKPATMKGISNLGQMTDGSERLRKCAFARLATGL